MVKLKAESGIWYVSLFGGAWQIMESLHDAINLIKAAKAGRGATPW